MEDAKIGTGLKIRLPNGYEAKASPSDDPVRKWTPDELTQHWIAKQNEAFFRQMIQGNEFLNHLYVNGYKPVPQTRWQRIKSRLTDAKSRLKNAWAALKGAPIDDGDPLVSLAPEQLADYVDAVDHGPFSPAEGFDILYGSSNPFPFSMKDCGLGESLLAGDIVDFDLTGLIGPPGPINQFIVVGDPPVVDPTRNMRLSEVGAVFRQIAKVRK